MCFLLLYYAVFYSNSDYSQQLHSFAHHSDNRIATHQSSLIKQYLLRAVGVVEVGDLDFASFVLYLCGGQKP